VSILAVPCHRDEIPAHDIAAGLATKFRVPVAASCGFHVEAASDEDIQKVLATTKMSLAFFLCAAPYQYLSFRYEASTILRKK